MKRNSDDKPKPKYLTAQDVADRYGLTRKWVYGCRTLPRRKVGKYLMFREDELEEFEKTWQKATPSHRTYQTKKETGQLASRNETNDWTTIPSKKKEFTVLFTMED